MNTKRDDRIYITDMQTGKVIGRVLTNHTMSFDELMSIAGFDWFDDKDGWSNDGGITIYDESDIKWGYKDS